MTRDNLIVIGICVLVFSALMLAPRPEVRRAEASAPSPSCTDATLQVAKELREIRREMDASSKDLVKALNNLSYTVGMK